jgi:hypothetical protein
VTDFSVTFYCVISSKSFTGFDDGAENLHVAQESQQSLPSEESVAEALYTPDCSFFIMFHRNDNKSDKTDIIF